MSHIYLLAGENLELAEAELEGFLRSQDVDDSLERTSRIVETSSEPGQLKRLALTHEVSEVIEKGSLDELDIEYQPKKTYQVRAIEIEADHNTSELEEKVGEILGTKGNSVDLDDPKEKIRLYLLEDSYILGKLVADIDRGLFNKRKNQERPFSSPVSLDPVTARVMVNLSEVSAGQHVLDPFCGTGGILIEAGLCGIGVHGLDISEEMVEGARENLEDCGIIVHDIVQGDVEDAPEIFEMDFKAVITDLPYGRASKVQDKPVEKFIEACSDMTDGKAVLMYDEPELNGWSHDFEIYIHKNLTRYIYVRDQE